MARNILDELERRVRDVVKELEQLLQPQRPARVPIPVPVRSPRDPRRKSYR
ncbi:MAG: hypothetical protein K8L99_23540 [Anaerolineae bacterium]|nr:hypothetical protein [Anaerolineae bacterium]